MLIALGYAVLTQQGPWYTTKKNSSDTFSVCLYGYYLPLKKRIISNSLWTQAFEYKTQAFMIQLVLISMTLFACSVILLIMYILPASDMFLTDKIHFIGTLTRI